MWTTISAQLAVWDHVYESIIGDETCLSWKPYALEKNGLKLLVYCQLLEKSSNDRPMPPTCVSSDSHMLICQSESNYGTVCFPRMCSSWEIYFPLPVVASVYVLAQRKSGLSLIWNNTRCLRVHRQGLLGYDNTTTIKIPTVFQVYNNNRFTHVFPPDFQKGNAIRVRANTMVCEKSQFESGLTFYLLNENIAAAPISVLNIPKSRCDIQSQTIQIEWLSQSKVELTYDGAFLPQVEYNKTTGRPPFITENQLPAYDGALYYRMCNRFYVVVNRQTVISRVGYCPLNFYTMCGGTLFPVSYIDNTIKKIPQSVVHFSTNKASCLECSIICTCLFLNVLLWLYFLRTHNYL